MVEISNMKTKQNGCFIFKPAKMRNGVVLELFFEKRGRFENYFEKGGILAILPCFESEIGAIAQFRLLGV